MSAVLWKLTGVGLGGALATVRRLADVTVELREGVTAVLGPSGAGKTSLLNLLVGYERPDAGVVTASLPETGHALPVYWVPQEAGLWPQSTVHDHLERAMSPGAESTRAAELLAALDIAHRAEAHPDELSQGERSRVAVARALAADPAVLVMDEPFASVDVARVGRYWRVVRGHVVERGCSLVFATHVPDAVLGEAERVVCLREGRLLYAGSVADLYWRPRSPEEADCLGEHNWLSPEESRLWLGRCEAAERCYRPEQVAITRSAESPVLVRSWRFKGAVAEAEVVHEPTGRRRRFVHRPTGDGLTRGARVALRALLALLLAVLAGCGGGADEPALAFRRVVHWEIPPQGARRPAPRVVAIGHVDEVFVVDATGRVLVFSPKGEVVGQWCMPDSRLGHPEGACVLHDGHLAVADTHYHRVVVFDPQGRVTRTFGRRGTGPGEFLFPVAVVQDAAGRLYVCEYGGNDRVQRFTRQGRFLGAFGSFGEGRDQFQRPAGMVWHEGRVYVADAMNNRVQVFTEDGRFLGSLGRDGAPVALHYPYDITLGPEATLYTVEYGAGRVTGMGLGGELVGRFGSTGRGEGQFQTPWGIAADSQGRLRVADAGNRRIVGLEP